MFLEVSDYPYLEASMQKECSNECALFYGEAFRANSDGLPEDNTYKLYFGKLCPNRFFIKTERGSYYYVCPQTTPSTIQGTPEWLPAFFSKKL